MEKEKQDVATKPAEVKEVESTVTASSVEVATDKVEETPAAAAVEDSKEDAPAPAAEESTEASSASPEDSTSDTAPAAAEESSETTEEENSGDQEASEETPEIKVSESNYNLLFLACCHRLLLLFFNICVFSDDSFIMLPNWYIAGDCTGRFPFPNHKSNKALLYPIY